MYKNKGIRRSILFLLNYLIMKKILIITYYWPPSGGAGVQRWLKFTKYMPEFGIQPVVLTVDPTAASYAQIDNSLQKDIAESTIVYRTKTFEFYNLYKRLTGKKEIPYGGFANEEKESFLQKIAKIVRGNFFLPDPRKGWNRYAFQKAIELIREHNIETVITTSPPHSTQLIGLKLKKKLGMNWIADLRDPWTNIYYYKELRHSTLAKRIDKKLELKVLENADKLITVSQDVKRIFEEKLKRSSDSKFLVVPNGYDEDDFKHEVKVANDKFVITYTGTISETYNIDGFLGVLSGLSQDDRKKVLLRFVGKVPTSIIKNIEAKIPDIELDLVGYVDHQKSIEYLLQSSLQLLVIPKVENNKGIITGKFFEYLASRKPILAIGPKGGDLENLIEETKCGQLFEYDDMNGMKKMIDLCLQNEYSIEKIDSGNYSRRALTQKLIQELSV